MASTDPRTIRLRRDDAVLDVAPPAGAAITRYALEGDDGPVDLLRPATAEAIEARTATGMGCFPLVPFSNRVAYGRFAFGGTEVELPPNFPPEPHTIHGHGWRAAWQVEERSPDSLTATYRHPADAWPFPYRATQTFRLDDEGLELALRIENEGDEAMPLGFGWHPFFVRTPETRVTAAVDRVWLSDEESLPDRLAPVPDRWTLGQGLRPDDVVLDNNFVGWDGRARIDWPERAAAVELEAEGPFGVLVVYTPSGEDFVCVEPASNVIDAFNLAARGRDDTGLLVLDPGAAVSGRLRLRPEDAR